MRNPRFIAEPGDFVPGRIPPRTPESVLRKLGVLGEPADVERAALREWLKSNEPNDILRANFAYSEFADLLE